jgi:predicted DNA-binding transcriptional regulator AlpA
MQPETRMPVPVRSSSTVVVNAADERDAAAPERLLATGEVAALLDVDEETVRRYRERWGLPHIRLPSGRCRYPELAVQRWVARHFRAFGEFK